MMEPDGGWRALVLVTIRFRVPGDTQSLVLPRAETAQKHKTELGVVFPLNSWTLPILNILTV